MKPTLSILIAVLIGVIGQLMLKAGLNSMGGLDYSAGLLKAHLRLFSSPMVVGGVLSYIGSVFFWLYALTKTDLSYAYPFLSLSYLLILGASWLFLGEEIPLIRWVGVMVICAGVVLVSRG